MFNIIKKTIITALILIPTIGLTYGADYQLNEDIYHQEKVVKYERRSNIGVFGTQDSREDARRNQRTLERMRAEQAQRDRAANQPTNSYGNPLNFNYNPGY